MLSAAQARRIAVQFLRLPRSGLGVAAQIPECAAQFERILIGVERERRLARDVPCTHAGLHGEVEMQQHGIERRTGERAQERRRNDVRTALRHVDRAAREVGKIAVRLGPDQRHEVERIRPRTRRAEHRAEPLRRADERSAADDRGARAGRTPERPERIGNQHGVFIDDRDPFDVGFARERMQTRTALRRRSFFNRRRKAPERAQKSFARRVIARRRRENDVAQDLLQTSGGDSPCAGEIAVL